MLPLPSSFRTLLAVASLTVAPLGCAAIQDQDGLNPFDDVALVDPPSSYRGRDILTPIIDVVSGSTNRLHDAIQRRISDCMADEGFAYFPIQFPVGRVDRNVDDPAWRSQSAYGIAEMLRTSQITGEDRNTTYIEGLNQSELQAYDSAMFGSEGDIVPLTNNAGQDVGFYQSGGCLASSMRAEIGYDNGQMQYNLDIVEGRRNDSIESMEADERWTAIWKDWSACMLTHGWEFTSRREAIDKVFEQAGGDAEAAARLENQVATVDDACSRELGTDAAVWRMRFSYQTAAIDSLAAFLGELSSVEDELSVATANR